MNEHSDASGDWDALRARIIGLGEHSIRKSHYPELERRLVELERFRALLDESNDLIFLAQIPSGRFVDVNESALRQLATARDALLAMSLADLVPGAVWNEMALLFAEEGQNCQNERTVVTTLRSTRGDLPVEISVRRVALGGVLYAVIVARDIGERLRAEAERQKTQAFLETAIAQSPSGVLIADAPDVKIRMANAAAFAIRGGDYDLLTGIDVAQNAARWQIYRPDGSPYPSEQLPLSRAVLRGEVTQGEEQIIRDAEGRDHWVSTNAAPIRNAEGHITAGIAVFHEISDRKRAEAAVSEAVQQWQATFDAANDAIFILDTDGRILRSNIAASHLFQRPEEDLLGKYCWQVVHGTAEPIPDCPGPRARRSLHRESMELQIGADWFQVTVDPILDAAGHYCGAVHIARDITERRQAEEALRESEGRLREAQQMAHLGHWFWDVKTGAVEWSDEVYKIFRLRPEEFTPQIDSIQALSPWPEDHQRDEELIRRATESRQQGSYEQRFLYPDGSTGYYYSTFQGIYDGDGELTAIKGTVQDITERKRAEAAVVSLARFPSENPHPVLRIGADGRMIYHNTASACLVQSWGCGVGIFLPASKKALVEAVLEAGGPQEVEEVIGDRVFALTFAPIKDAGYVNIYGLDITDRKRAEEALTERVQQMNVLNDLMKRASSSLSLDQVAQSALDGIASLVEADMSLLFTRDGDQLFLRAERWEIPAVRHDGTPVHKVGQCLCGVAVSQEKAIYSLDIRNDPRCTWRECKDAGLVSLAALPLRSGEGIVGVLAVGSVAACDFSRQATFLEAMSHGIAAGIQNAFLYEQLKNHATQLEREIAERIRAEEALLAHQRRLRSLASELSLAEERERRRIATGLHDHACQTLVLSKMKLQELRAPLAPAQEDEIARICSTLDGTIGNVRELIFDLSSPTLYKFGLEAALQELLEDKMQTEHGIHCTFCDDGAAKPLAEDVRVLLFQSVRELLINIVKHAHAREVTLGVGRCDDSICITITDDGIGFDVEDVLSAPSRSRGFGLFNIRERLEYIGGGLEIHAQPGQGSRFTLMAHLETNGRRRAEAPHHSHPS